MRRWIIVLAALSVALVVDFAWLWPKIAAAPGLDPASAAARHLWALATVGLALYALVALVLVAGMIVLDATRVEFRLARLAAPNQQDWMAAFAATALSPLAPRILDLAPLDRDWARTGIVLQSRFDTVQARREIDQLYSSCLVRAQFVTALAILLALAALGFARDYGHLANVPASIPAVLAIAAVVVLALFGVLGRMIVGAAAEPLFGTISNLPVERLEIELLRRLVWLSEEGDATRVGGSEAALSSAIGKLLARLVDALDESRISLVETIAGLATQAEALAIAMRLTAEHGPERGDGRVPASDLAELRSTVAQLRTIMEGLAAAAHQSPPASAAGRESGTAESGASRSDLGREVRSLLANLE